ncbi:uncharacterized protein EI97DRAFT_387025 [Westerdykella ornata]|uniref:DUF8004 domain-containing protein n=1 Tax=Westerdykella ornata TaxID=318751 RepID=A0A6A6J6L5_WESOR|nr:uncharacterized protein EI97DRAFT_387025 [Westerdykella ornata]KAF2271854.1 hypothetical protein EI97DRAFT_387025 [Westerdykella ornata]
MADKKRSSSRLSSLLSLTSIASDNSESSPMASSEPAGRFRKVRNRISSATHLSPVYPPPGTAAPANLSTTIQPLDSAPPVLASPDPPPPIPAPRSCSDPPTRPHSSAGIGSRDPQLLDYSKLKKLKRRSAFFAGPRSSDERLQERGPLAWIVGHQGKLPYDLTLLLNGEKVPELWDEEGDTLLYLFPRMAGKGPSFRVDSSLYASSQYMTRLVHGRLYSDASLAPQQGSRRNWSTTNTPSRPGSPDRSVTEGSSDGSKGSRALSDATEDDHSEKHLYLPIRLSTDSPPVTAAAREPGLSVQDIDTLVTYRNFVAFLMGQSLVATERHPDIFTIFMRIADILEQYQFSNFDGSTFGEVAASSFDCYVDELHLADVRASREKTIEAIVLGERMRSLALYTEGFVHAAGKFENIKQLRHSKFDLISRKTATRLARASMDLDLRLKNTNTKLADFDFPAIFSGIMNSDTADEKKVVRFKNWRAAFMACRSFALDYYKSKYGSWLPKAKSKKNNLTTSGLNRLVLLDLYNDFSDLYDLLVDRTNLTTRTADGFMTNDESTDFEAVVHRALRKVLSEYDRSTPPVQPPIPFDLPLYPTLRGGTGDYPSGDPKKDAKARSKKLKADDISRMIRQSHNADAEQHTDFLEAFRRFEHKQASGCTTEELWEMRSGHWLFLYAVIQSLPMLVVDAPGVRFTEGVEYFLCEPPRSGVPWGREDSNRARTWFGVAGGSQVVSLPTDVVEHGVEGVFRRSHCWKMAERWSKNDAMLQAAVHETIDSEPLPPPPGVLIENIGSHSRSQSPDRRRESVMNLGLEALPLPATIGPSTTLAVRPASSNDPTKTFDAILSSAELSKPGKKKR